MAVREKGGAQSSVNYRHKKGPVRAFYKTERRKAGLLFKINSPDNGR